MGSPFLLLGRCSFPFTEGCDLGGSCIPLQFAYPDPFDSCWSCWLFTLEVTGSDAVADDSPQVLHVVVKTVRNVHVIVQPLLAWHGSF